MAYVQASGSAEAYTAKHNVAVQDMMNQSHCLIPKHCSPAQEKAHAVVGGHLQNITKGEIKFHAKHEWSGRSKVPYPQNIAKKHAGKFVHTSGCNASADIAAVVYAGSTDDCAYLVAWSVRDQHDGCRAVNKVYVEAGSIDNYIEINWADIKCKLDESCETSYYVDESTGCEAFAKISHGHHAALVASFTNNC
uniref:Uncharacterized protein n=1 Tax=Mesembryanthemum crystallinum TaxID=3544 RepID=A0A0Y0RY96_MESCR|nr:hypothetical protein [Mesembryanthemum crystallinum]